MCIVQYILYCIELSDKQLDLQGVQTLVRTEIALQKAGKSIYICRNLWENLNRLSGREKEIFPENITKEYFECSIYTRISLTLSFKPAGFDPAFLSDTND